MWGWADDKTDSPSLFLSVWMNAYFHFLYLFFHLPFSFSISLVPSMSCSERVRGVWAYGVSPSNNKYRKRVKQRDSSRKREVWRNQGNRYCERERQRKQETWWWWWWCWGGQQLAFDGEACLFNECISPLNTYPQITASH